MNLIRQPCDAVRIPILLADYPADVLTGLCIVACTVGAGLLCLCVAGAIRLAATDATFRRRAVRGWLIAAGVCVLGCAVLPERLKLPMKKKLTILLLILAVAGVATW